MPSRDLVFRFVGLDAGAGREFDRMAGKSASLEHSIGKLGVAVAGMGVALGVESVRAAAKFQTAMELIHTQAGATQAEVNKMSKAVLALAGPTATAPDTLAAGLYHLESAGFRGKKALDALKTAAEGARLGGANLEDVTNALNATLVSGISGAQNMSKAMGALNATVGAGDMRMQDLSEALGTGVLAAVKGFGLSLNDVGAALATFGDNNIRGADAATQLRMAVLFMAKPAASAKNALKELGMTQHELADDMRKKGLGGALADLHKHLIDAGDTGAKMGQVLLDMFGHKAGTGIAILEQQFGRFQTKQKEVATGSKNFASDWGAYTQTFGYQWGRAQSAFQAMTIQLGQKLLPTATKAMNWIGTTGVADLDKFGGWVSRNKTPIEDLAKVLGTIAAFRFTTGKLNDLSRLLGFGSKGLGGVGGGILGSAKPIPVYVTNAGFGGGKGIPGVGGGSAAKTAEGDLEKYGPAAVPWLGRVTKALGPKFVGGTAVAAAITIAGMHDPKNGAADVRTAQTNPAVMQRYKELLAGYERTHPVATTDARSANITDKLIRQAIKDVNGYAAAVKNSANDIEIGKSALAHFRANLVNQHDAVKGAIAAFKQIPGAMQALAMEVHGKAVNIGAMLDAGLTIGIQAGAGKVNIVTKQVVDGVVHTATKAAAMGSPSKKTAYIGQMLAAGLELGLRSGKKGVGQAASQLMDSVFGAVSGQASLSNMSMVDSLGASGGGTSMSDLLAFYGGQASNSRALARNLAIARKKGLSSALAGQVAMEGPNALPFAQSLAGASRAQIRALNADEAAVTRYAHQVAGTVSLSDSTIAKLGRAFRPVVHQTTPAQLDRHNGKKILAHG